jgi:glycerol-3-phosphate dehydrogenase
MTVPSYDVAVIGAGIVGSAISRELSGYELSVALIEARDDVGGGTSKANTAILHTGFDAKPGTLESALVSRGHGLLSEFAQQTGIPIEHTGAVLVAWDDEQLEALPALKDKAEANGYHACQLIDAATVYAMIPHLGVGALGGLTVPDESITCTWTVNLAMATDAVNRGAVLLTNHRVERIDVGDEVTSLYTSAGPIMARWVVNAAGLGADLVDGMFGHSRFTVTPRRGELIVYDKLARPLVEVIVLPVPTTRGKGVLVSPTIYGNVMLGPTSEDIQDRTATATTEAGLDFLLEKGRVLMPRLLDEEITATYTGLRAAIDHGDYLIETDAAQRYLLVGGIRSTGLTAGLAIGEYAGSQLRDAGLNFVPRTELPAPPQMPNLGEATVRPYQDSGKIAEDPEYGAIVCFCERVTAGELRDACHSVIPPAGLDGLRRRTRVMNGRCQGFFCGGEVQGFLDSMPMPATPRGVRR